MSFILIRRTNYPLEGEGTSFYLDGKKISHPNWIEISKRWHLGPKEGGTFWSLYPDRWVKHPLAEWTTLIVYKETFDEYDIYVRPFGDGSHMDSKGWTLLEKEEYESRELLSCFRKPEFYLVRRQTWVISSRS